MDPNDDTLIGPPKRIGGIQSASIKGLLMPWKDDQPVLITFMGSSAAYLPLFSTPQELVSGLLNVAEWTSIKKIDDGLEFISSVPVEINVIMNLHLLPDGTRRFSQIER